MELKEIKNPNHETKWKAARWGVIIFYLIPYHLNGKYKLLL
jgi:hypothetical protein